jgi:hypothetical protein
MTELLHQHLNFVKKRMKKQADHSYVQNVSTFPNTFAIVSPLICVF